MSAHLLHERLLSQVHTPEETEHLASCRPCRRWQGPHEPSSLLLGRYAVVGLLGTGGMARVDAAFDLETGQRVALKRMALHTPELSKRFLREVAAQRRVAHDHVLPLLDVLALPEGPALVLPLVAGPSLRALLAQRGLERETKLSLFRDLVEGVAALHAAGLVHRDLKPSNVLLDVSGERVLVKVADFGLAKFLDPELSAMTRTGEALGTPAYRAPEQRDAAHVDTRADVYALGVMLSEMLTGARPAGEHPGESAWDELARQMLLSDPSERLADAACVLARMPPTGPLPDGLSEALRALTPELVEPEPPPEIPHNLPLECDAFVGRHEELGALAEAVARARLVSVLGGAGIGKTRLALRYAALWLEGYPGGTWFCDLSEARDADGIVMALARSLDVPLGVGDMTAQLGHALAARGRCLVLLDNFEQVQPQAADTLGRWLLRADQAHFLVTTRQALSLPGEHLFELPVLAPDDAQTLFLRRAQEAAPSLSLPPAEREAVPSLVALLDGLPLAIELAAARVKVLAPSKILERMTERFRLLAAPGRKDRHATLRAALDWSWDLLTEDEQVALAQLSVFQGGLTQQAAEAVLALERPLEAVISLTNKSLVRRTHEERLGLLVSVQEYAARKLGPEQRAAAEERHGRFFARFGSNEALDSLKGPEAVAQSRAFARELDNLGVACRRAAARGDGDVAAYAAFGAWATFSYRGPFAEGAALLALVQGCSEELGAGVAERLGEAFVRQGRLQEALAHLEEARARAQALGLRQLEVRAMSTLSLLYKSRGRMDEASVHCEAALALCRAAGDRHGEGVALTHLANIRRARGQLDEAHALYEAALAVCQEVPSRSSKAAVLANFGLLQFERGQEDQARISFESALALAREVGNRHLEGTLLSNLGALAQEQERQDESRAYCEAALALHRLVGDRVLQSISLNNLGQLEQNRGQLEEARQRYEEALVICREVGNRRLEGSLLGNLALTYQGSGRADEARAHFEAAIALHRTTGDRSSEGRALTNLGHLHSEQGRQEEARACFDAGLSLLRQLSAPRELVRTLAFLAVHEHRAGALEAARAALQEAEQLAQLMTLQGGAELAQARVLLSS